MNVARPKKYEFWASVIDGKKDACQIAKELNVARGTVYQAAQRYNLPLPRTCDLKQDYHGVTLEQLKNIQLENKIREKELEK